MRVWTANACRLDADFLRDRHVGNAHVLTIEGDPDAGWRLIAWGDEPLTDD
jgi:probable phosphoglycerate mutase